MLVSSQVCANAAETAIPEDRSEGHPALWLNAGWLSWHFRKAGDRNAINLGAGLEMDVDPQWTMAGGVYRNSFNNSSVYLGFIRQFWVDRGWRLGLMMGVVNGYRHLNDGAFCPYVFPVLQYQGAALGMNLALVPVVDSVTGGLIAVQFKVRF